ncbi:MAG: TlpA disulfide reductase family protein [Saprospiraceae bacterium]|jgi:cytochrome c biogenesis protein CcmG/thiol:disulfide interchange protein DsbE|nr:TlpA disulfide reductase family protein [Saprospiraceae bacterium]MDG2419492.1 TlpA disulfide reductase family protein [Saprospiraceae bacterium]
MKLINILLVVFAFCFSSSVFAQKNLPNVNVKDLKGKTINIQDFAKNGKITVISFWATWCSPCKRELDAIAEIYPDWQENYNAEVVAVTIDNARAMAKVPGMVETKQWDYLILSDVNQDLQRALNFQSVPQTFLLNQEGNIVYTHTGYVSGDEYELEDKIKALAGK